MRRVYSRGNFRNKKEIESLRKASKTVSRTWDNMSDEYREKIRENSAKLQWNKKRGPYKKSRKWLKKKLYPIVPRERNYSGVVYKEEL